MTRATRIAQAGFRAAISSWPFYLISDQASCCLLPISKAACNPSWSLQLELLVLPTTEKRWQFPDRFVGCKTSASGTDSEHLICLCGPCSHRSFASHFTLD